CLIIPYSRPALCMAFRSAPWSWCGAELFCKPAVRPLSAMKSLLHQSLAVGDDVTRKVGGAGISKGVGRVEVKFHVRVAFQSKFRPETDPLHKPHVLNIRRKDC